ncbi:MAG TPA: SCO family protein [Methylibium sp.]|nr:SCO family protein [Methylibium sp.]
MLRRCLLVLGTAALLAGCDRAAAPPPAAFQAIDITGADYAKELPLPDLDGRARTLAEFSGKAVVVFFGFTQCPDVCPTTLAELASVKKALGPAGERVQTVFISLDPERDTAELLKTYVAAFDPTVVALRGTPEQTLAAAKSYKVFFQKVPGKEPGSYSIDHTAGAYVFDPKGQVRLFVRYGQPVDAWVSDLKQLLG